MQTQALFFQDFQCEFQSSIENVHNLKLCIFTCPFKVKQAPSEKHTEL